MVNVINLHDVNDVKLWLTHPDNVYIGRQTKTVQGSKWGNPYVITWNFNRRQAVQHYKVYIHRNKELLQSLGELRGKTLGCWCAPRWCHGHILKQLLDSTTTIKASSHNQEMSRTKKRSKATPQKKRKSSRNRKRTQKGKYYDNHILENDNSPLNAKTEAVVDDVAVNVLPEPSTEEEHLAVGGNSVKNSSPMLEDVQVTTTSRENSTLNKLGLNLTTSTPSIISETTLPIEYRARKLELNETNLKLELEQAVLLPCNSEENEEPEFNLSTFPESVVRVDPRFVKDIKFVNDLEGDIDDESQTLFNLYMLWKQKETCFNLILPSAMLADTVVYTEIGVDVSLDPVSLAVDPRADELITEQSDPASKDSEMDRLLAVLAVEEMKRNELQQLLSNEKQRNDHKSKECELLQTQLFKKTQELKIADARIDQLQNNNAYRKEVIRLEQIVQDMEEERMDLIENLKKQSEEINVIRENLSDVMTENMVLKNTAKVQCSHSEMQTENIRKHFSDLGVQTDITGLRNVQPVDKNYAEDTSIGFGIDFGIDSSTQTDAVHCDRCATNGDLLDELIELLETIEKNIAYTKSRECQEDIKELVRRLDSIEKEVHLINGQHGSTSVSDVKLAMRSSSKTVHPSGTAYIPAIEDTTLSKFNHYHPLQQVNNTHQNNITVAGNIPIKPGINTYSDVVRGATEKVSVFSTSITKGIDLEEFNAKYVGKSAKIHRFHGKKARHLKHYIPVHMDEDKADTCVIIAGGNDLSDKTPILKIANELMEAALTCKRHGAQNIVISSVLPRSTCEQKRVELNKILMDLCDIHNFVFMDNWNMSLQHVSYDGVHLNRRGDKQLLFNLLWYLNA